MSDLKDHQIEPTQSVDGVPVHCADCNQPIADHVNGCPTYPPLGIAGVTCPAAAGATGLQGADAGRAAAQKMFADPVMRQIMENLHGADGGKEVPCG